jgi:nitrogen fixation NifU-like protein
MAEALRGKPVGVALAMVEQFQGMMKGAEEFPQEFRKLNVMQGVSQFPVRIKCATLPWHTLKAALELTSPVAKDGFISNESDS